MFNILGNLYFNTYFSCCICRQQTFHDAQAIVFFNMCAWMSTWGSPNSFLFSSVFASLKSLINHCFHSLWPILYLHCFEVLNYRIWDILKSRNLQMLIQYHSPHYHDTSSRIQQYLQKKMLLLSSSPHESMLQPPTTSSLILIKRRNMLPFPQPTCRQSKIRVMCNI